jgi:protocatechuate 3,4-dioxygenase beta subunit
MNRIIYTACLASCLALFTSCSGQPNNTTPNTVAQTGRVGGECEAGYCDLMYLGMPETITEVDTSAGWYEQGQKLVVTGTVFQLDGKTPAPDVIIYYHHTDHKGYYSPGDGKPENRTRHGHIRGWVKSDAHGKYTIYTNLIFTGWLKNRISAMNTGRRILFLKMTNWYPNISSTGLQKTGAGTEWYGFQ